MPEIGTSGSMSGDGKRSVGHRPQATAPILDSTAVAERLGGAPSESLSMDRNLPADPPAPPHRSKCGKPMALVTVVPRVTEPGRVVIFQCEDCEELDFKPATRYSKRLDRHQASH
jgi:hypothetical protein